MYVREICNSSDVAAATYHLGHGTIFSHSGHEKRAMPRRQQDFLSAEIPCQDLWITFTLANVGHYIA